jgi:hypothetical protein
MRRRAAITVVLGLLLLIANAARDPSWSAGRAPFGPYKGKYPAPGAITAFDSVWFRPHDETKAGAPPFLRPNSTNPALFKVGTLQVPDDADSIVILFYGDNRAGWRMMTTPWGVPAILQIGSPDFTHFLWGVVNIPVALVQAVVPKLDLFQDLYSLLWSHKFSGGGEKRVLAALQKELERRPKVSFIIQTGDVVENGRRGGQWEDFAKRFAHLRETAPYLASPGNHERLYHPLGQANWNAVMGPPAQPGRYWFAIDFPESLARFVFLDTNVLADPSDRYPDSLENALSNEQIAWLDSALAVPARYRFVVMHHPLVTSGHYLSNWEYDDSKPLETRRRGRILDICHRRHVTAVIAGHEHLYQRTFVEKRGTGFWHIATGGAGAPLYRISEEQRLAALSVTLPDSSHVTWTAARSAYHYGRITILRHPKPGEEYIRLDVYQVLDNGKVALIDHQDLTDYPREPTANETTIRAKQP